MKTHLILVAVGIALTAAIVPACGQNAPAPDDKSMRGIPGVATQRAAMNFAELARQAALLSPVPPAAGLATPAGFAPASMGAPPFSPASTDSFLACEDDGTAIVPDTHGAVGPNHLVVALNSVIRIQDRAGGTRSTVSLSNFWARLGPFAPPEGCTTLACICDPRILFDASERRWISTAIGGRAGRDFSLLIAVSQTDDPTGGWNAYRVLMDTNATLQQWFDFPCVGFNKHWIVVQGGLYTGGRNTIFAGSRIYAFNKTNMYAGGQGFYTTFQRADIGDVQWPALTHDPDNAVLYLLGNHQQGVNMNSVRLYHVSGAVGSEVFTLGPIVTVTQRWDHLPIGGFNAGVLPQLGTAAKIAPTDSAILGVVLRDGSLWAAQHVHLPAGGSPRRTAIQWWQIEPGGTVIQRGLIDDPTGTDWFSHPSLAVNKFNDVLVGYSRFSTNQYPSANYAFRAANDPPGTLRQDTVLKSGEASFFRPDPCNNRNRWGDYSATVVDPVNDTDLWTIQQYAATVVSSQSRWGTWWGHIVPTFNVGIVESTVTEGDADATNAVFTVSLSRTNDQIISVEFATANGSALAGLDYAASNGTVVFKPGEASKTILVPVLDDVQDELNETFFVTLSNPTNIALAYTRWMGSILDNDPLPAISIDDIAVREGDAGLANATFSFSLSAPSGLPVSFRAITANGSAVLRIDYVPTNRVITIPPGDSQRTQTIQIVSDTLIESNEVFLVTLSSPTNATIADIQGRCTILDDDFKVTALEFAGTDVRLSFPTETGHTYRVERTDSLAAPIAWEPAPGAEAIAGTGAAVSVLDPGAASRAQRFYRVRVN